MATRDLPVYIRRILSGHGISNIYYFTTLTKSSKGKSGSHHYFYTNASGLRSWVYKMWAMVS